MKKQVTAAALVGALALGGVNAAFAQGTSPTTGVPTTVATTAPRPTTAAGSGTTGSTVGTTQAPVNDNDDGFDWGWLGLAGLAGLAPLFMRRKHEEVHVERRVETTEPNVRRVA